MTDSADCARRDARFLKEFADRVSSKPRMPGCEKAKESVSGLVRERKNYGDKLLQAGAVLLIIPDPITDAAAIPVLAAGKILSSRQSSNLKDIYSDLSKTLTSLASLSSCL